MSFDANGLRAAAKGADLSEDQAAAVLTAYFEAAAPSGYVLVRLEDSQIQSKLYKRVEAAEVAAREKGLVTVPVYSYQADDEKEELEAEQIETYPLSENAIAVLAAFNGLPEGTPVPEAWRCASGTMMKEWLELAGEKMAQGHQVFETRLVRPRGLSSGREFSGRCLLGESELRELV